MNRILFLLLILGISNSSFSQNWAPVGTKWHYKEGFANYGDIDFIRFESVKDTLFMGKNCRKIIKRHQVGCLQRPNVEYMYSEDNKVYFYDEYFSEFQLLYDFNADVNDFWKIKIPDINSDVDTLVITVDEIDNIILNGYSLKRQFVTIDFLNEQIQSSYNSTIIESIGDLSYMFNFMNEFMFVCDDNFSDGINCYEDNLLGLNHFNNNTDCEFQSVGLSELQNDETLRIYPNLVYNTINLINSDKYIYYKIYDLAGKLLKEDSFSKNINIEDISKGIYILEVVAIDLVVSRTKFIK